MKNFFRNIARAAEDLNIANEKPLTFFGVVHRADTIDRWEVLVSGAGLEHHDTETLNFIFGFLRKRLTRSEFVQLAGVVVLPPDNPDILALRSDPGIRPGELSIPFNRDFDRAFVIIGAGDRNALKREPAVR